MDQKIYSITIKEWSKLKYRDLVSVVVIVSFIIIASVFVWVIFIYIHIIYYTYMHGR